jgi:hypothetical protein
MGILWKMAVFIEKPNVKFKLLWNYKMLRYSSNLAQMLTGPVCSILHFLLPWERGTSQNCQKHYFALIFYITTDFKVLQPLNGLRYSQRLFSVGYTLPFYWSEANFSHSQVQNLGGAAAPFKPLSRKHITSPHPSLAPPWCIFLIGDDAGKVITFF